MKHALKTYLDSHVHILQDNNQYYILKYEGHGKKTYKKKRILFI